MCKTYAYCRVSTPNQSLDRQERLIKAEYPDAVAVKEKYTGTKVFTRPEFAKLYAHAKEGDRIVFEDVDRMARNAGEGVRVYMELYTRGVELVFIKRHSVDTAVYKKAMETQALKIELSDGLTSKLVNNILELFNDYQKDLQREQVFKAFEEAEVENNKRCKRVAEGVETARLNGKQIGQKQGAKLNVKKALKAKEIIRKHSRDFNGTLSDSEVITLAGISRNSFYKYKRELRAEVEG